MKSLALFVICIFLLGLVRTSFAKDSNIPPLKIIAKTEPLGQIVSAVIIEYPEDIDPSVLTTKTFEVLANRINEYGGEVGPRTVTKVYTNSKPDLTAKPVVGKYVIIELYPQDVNAGTIYYDVSKGGFNFNYDLEYTVVQKENIKTVVGNILPARVIKGKDKIDLSADKFQHLVYERETGEKIAYSLFIPKNYDPKNSYPLVVFLHGAGERGFDNQVHLKANKGAVVWTEDEVQSKYPCFVLAPQCPHDSFWTKRTASTITYEPSVHLEMVYELIRQLQEKYSIDKNRIYLTGLSMGGIGTWALSMAHPDVFAALAPICGMGDVNKVELIRDIPVWVFTAEDDPVVKVELVRATVEALKKVGGNVRYTEYERGVVSPPLAPMAHFSWVPAYNNKAFIDWIFAQNGNR